MNEYLVRAIQTIVYEVVVKAEDAEEAIASLDDWIADDFAEYQVDGSWDLVAEEF
jgi:hypothetical protein